MARYGVAAVALAIGVFAPSLAQARFTFQAGDAIYADGQWFTSEEYEQYKKAFPQSPPKPPPTQRVPGYYAAPPQETYVTPPAYQPPQTQGAPTTTMVDGKPVITVAPPPVLAPLDSGATMAAAPGAGYAPQAGYAVPVAAAPVLRAATCRTTKSYSEFPADTEKFDCGAAGKLSRQEMLARGWKIDFVEKVSSGYKIILSR